MRPAFAPEMVFDFSEIIEIVEGFHCVEFLWAFLSELRKLP
jgi:hypothetical protein